MMKYLSVNVHSRPTLWLPEYCKVFLVCLLMGFLCSYNASAQRTTITGKVVSVENDETLPGVNVVEKGTSNGTITDVDGNYSLSVSQGATLIFSSVGFMSTEAEVGNRSVINITLDPDIKSLEEIVVVGYGTQKKSDLTGAVASVSSEELNSQPITSIEQGLQGRLAGVAITQNSSAPGGGISVKIRGTTSILNGSEPLYVIDGFPVTGQSQFSTSAGRGLDSSTGSDYTVNQNPLAALNPSDIQSIEVLKDASAAAIYGVRGANGVVLITTKRGQQGAPRVSYNGYVGIQSSAKKIEMMNAEEYQNIYNVAEVNGGFSPVFTEDPPYDTDWQDLIFRDALMQNHQLSISGGTEAVQYLVSGSFFDQEGIVKGSEFGRYSLRVNLDMQASDKLKFGNSLNVSRAVNNAANTEGESRNGITSVALEMSPILPIYQPDGTYSSNRFIDAPDAQGSLNPVAFINEFSDENVTTRMLGTLFGEYSITDELKLRVSIGADLEQRDRHVFFSSKFNNENPLSSANVSVVNRKSLLNENTLTYTKNFGKHGITALAGFTVQQEEEEYRLITARGLATDITGPYDLGSGSVVPNVSSAFAEFSLASFLGRINYNFDDRFLITVTGRRDGSSKFAEGNKWAFFPSIAGAWRISNEPFMANATDIIDNLKLRAGYGLVGNQELPSYRSLALLQSTNYNFGEGGIVSGFSPLRVSVPNLTWEITNQTNIGVDVSLFESRFNFTVDYYIKKTEDLLLEVSLPETSGIVDPSVQNLGQMENIGWEFSADGVIIDNNDFSWNLGLNLSTNKNEITSLGNSDVFGDLAFIVAQPTFAGSTARSYVQLGEPIGVFWGYKTDGLYRSQAEADAGQDIQPGVIPGMVRYVDVDGNGTLDDDDRTVLGSPFPDMIYGLSSNIRYKDFELRFFLQGQEGGNVYNMMRRFNTSVARGQNVLREVNDYWTPENPNAKWPTPNSNPPLVGGQANLGDSDWYLEDASYLRMREITLAYNFPENFLGKVGGSVYVTGQNLFTITDYTGYNPDTNGRSQVKGSFGYDVSSYPMARTYILGLKLDF